MADLVDLTSDLKELALLAGRPAQVEDLLTRALDGLAEVVPYDLAAVLELHDDLLVVRCARGRLANDRVRRHRIALRDFPSVRAALEHHRARVFTERDHAEGDGDAYDGVLDLPHGHACMVVPLFAHDATLGALTFDQSHCGSYEPAMVNLATIYAQIIALAMQARGQAELLERYQRRLQEQNRLLTAEVTGASDAGQLLARSESPAMRELTQMAQQGAGTDAPVLITGETGVGKEVLARAIHSWSRRAAAPFVKINCAALPENLVESELFGHTKGAFSGATASRPGRFAVANGGTLLLDEIGDLPLAMQGKLLRVLQEGTFEPVGSDRSVKVDVRILAATHVDLEQAIDTKRFRADLFYRLNVFPLRVPALRERRADIPMLAAQILDSLARRTGRGPWHLHADTLQRLDDYPWPGNVRELVNLLERAAILTPAGPLELEPPRLRTPARRSPDAAVSGAPTEATGDTGAAEAWPVLATLERDYIQRVLQHTAGKIYGPDGAATILGLKPTTLQSRMHKLGVRRPGV